MIEKKSNHTIKFAGVTRIAREHAPIKWSTKQGMWQTAGERQAALFANYYRGRRVIVHSLGSPFHFCTAVRTPCFYAVCFLSAAWTPSPRWPRRCTWSSRTGRWGWHTWPNPEGSSAASGDWSRDLRKQHKSLHVFTYKKKNLTLLTDNFQVQQIFKKQPKISFFNWFKWIHFFHDFSIEIQIYRECSTQGSSTCRYFPKWESGASAPDLLRINRVLQY